MMVSRDDWRKIKAKYGIPDAVCKWSMGERVAKWKKADEGVKGDYGARVAALESLIKDMHIYAAALKNVKTTKFKGKTGSEQANSYKGALGDYAKEIADYESLRSNYNRLAKPLDELKTQLKAAISKFSSIGPNDDAKLTTFYGQQIRNDVGLPLIQAAKMDAALKPAQTAYNQHAETVNSLVNKKAPGYSAKVHAECKAALEGLQTALGN